MDGSIMKLDGERGVYINADPDHSVTPSAEDAEIPGLQTVDDRKPVPPDVSAAMHDHPRCDEKEFGASHMDTEPETPVQERYTSSAWDRFQRRAGRNRRLGI